MTDPTTRRADAIALAKRVRADLDHFGKRADNVSLLPDDLRILCDAVLSAPDSDGAALRKILGNPAVNTKDGVTETEWWCGEKSLTISIGGKDGDSVLRAWGADAQTQMLDFVFDPKELPMHLDWLHRELAARQDTPPCPTQMNESNSASPMGTDGSNATATGSDAKATSLASASGAAFLPRPSSPIEHLADPAREPDEIEAWRRRATTGQADDTDIERALAIMRRHRDRADAAEAELRRVERLADDNNTRAGTMMFERDKCCDDYQREAARADAAEQELRAACAAGRALQDELAATREELEAHIKARQECKHILVGESAVQAVERLAGAVAQLGRDLDALRAAKPAPTSERVQQLRAKLEKAIDGLVGESLNPSGNSGNSDLDRLPLHDANREVEHYVDELCALASRVAEPAGDGALREAVASLRRRIRPGQECAPWVVEEIDAALAAQEPPAGVPANQVKWIGDLCEALGLLSTLKGDLDCGRLTNEPVQCAREIHDHVTQQLAAARAEARNLAVEELRKVQFDLGAPNADAYKVITRRIAAIESQAKPEAAAATDAEREGDDVLREFAATNAEMSMVQCNYDDAEAIPKIVKAIDYLATINRELCRRALRGGQ